jgi:hypothetical protein
MGRLSILKPQNNARASEYIVLTSAPAVSGTGVVIAHFSTQANERRDLQIEAATILHQSAVGRCTGTGCACLIEMRQASSHGYERRNWQPAC